MEYGVESEVCGVESGKCVDKQEVESGTETGN